MTSFESEVELYMLLEILVRLIIIANIKCQIKFQQNFTFHSKLPITQKERLPLLNQRSAAGRGPGSGSLPGAFLMPPLLVLADAFNLFDKLIRVC